MNLYNCKLSFEEQIQAEDEDEAMEKFLNLLNNLSGGWEADNTEIEFLENTKIGEDNVEFTE